MKHGLNIIRLFVVSLLISVPSIGVTGGVGDRDADEAASQLTDLLSGMKSYQSDFKQVTLDGGGNHIQQTEGSLAVKRPGLLYWKAEAPTSQTIVADGKELWLYDEDLEQVTVQRLDQRVSQTPALLLSGKVEQLTASYEISGQQIEGDWFFKLIPKDPDSLFEQLKLTFVKGVLAEMHMNDSLGQRTTLAFVNAEVNPSLDAKLFEFTPPEGIDVIR